MYQATTQDINVSVLPVYIDERSDPENDRFFWAYRVEIANEGLIAVQLLERHWRIVDGLGREENVHGPGVVGMQPVIEPGNSFEYTSGCPLTTPSGFMHGSYTVEAEDGSRFEIAIPSFPLDLPNLGATLN